jgi:hypothetical protein
MKRLRALIRGMIEWRNDVTTHYPYPLIEWYDRGRTIANHVLRNDGNA